MIIENVLIVDPLDGEYVGSVEFEDVILDVKKSNKSTYDNILMPAFVDPHIHGIKGIDTMTASQEDFKKFKEFEALEGVWYFQPTTVTCPLTKLSEINLPSDLKLHIEGPFIASKRKGAHNEAYIQPPPRDVHELERYLPLSYIGMITVAPEYDTFMEFARSCEVKGIRISLGHSDATFEQVKSAFENGFKRITHFPNALSPLHHRELGVTGAGLLLDFTLEIIADGIHCSPDFVRLVYKIKGAQRIILVTDSISAAGLKDGSYMLGDLHVRVENGIAKLHDGTLAGSTLRFSQAIKNFVKFTDCSLKELAMVSSYNACKDLNLNGGRIKKGHPAKLILLDKDLNIKKVWNF
ncbi:N-acetylglucosamine 6-phosphate deacetylase [Fervidobacterium changbaicum]|uniref:N-acetylglucosamine-6-phosphate deacetylase n=1 Tax=Fervidobacterium changbaicum TaxID=310769 RepID=A0ABX5QQK5_9BACT|nr:N-acetylglucosamine-6-phosphate deacetylase [Fervidobacterium changbaicum]QAV32761.1 N-acetylglucosamine-6-phosphate deacetylase [Fervidobacterium changbaicum]SDG96518.1 N-acetylglucosamine 6-phosphate deacetylase [Fervidobacterium changbaicum]